MLPELLQGVSVQAVGHRVAHGGQLFVVPTRIDMEVVAALRSLIPLAPLHNPANIAGIEVALRLLPEAVHVAVFDTAFHATLPSSRLLRAAAGFGRETRNQEVRVSRPQSLLGGPSGSGLSGD